MLQKSLRAAGIRFQNPCQFWKGVREGPLEKRRSNDAGSAALASAPWQSLRRQPEGVARFKGYRRCRRPRQRGQRRLRLFIVLSWELERKLGGKIHLKIALGSCCIIAENFSEGRQRGGGEGGRQPRGEVTVAAFGIQKKEDFCGFWIRSGRQGGRGGRQLRGAGSGK